MISQVINPNKNYSFGQRLTVLNSSPTSTQNQNAKLILQKADEYLQNGDFNNAINAYKSYLVNAPYDTEANLDIAKTYTYNEQFAESIPHFQRYLAHNPNDIEILTMLGENYKKTKYYDKAIECFKKALAIEPHYDYANRNLLDTQNLQLALINPQKAQQEKYDTAIQNLTQAVKIAKSFLPKGFTNDMKDITVSFDKTAKMGGRSNIAQYEHNKRKISITDEYTYADPRLTGAYIIHEFIHGKDNDPYTSIREEQDAYRTQAKYWVSNSNNLFDPEMDYVADLYKESAQALDNRVAEIYKLRDPDITQTSYNHPPTTNTNSGMLLSKDTAGQPLKEYDIIV